MSFEMRKVINPGHEMTDYNFNLVAAWGKFK
jgi:hypothetical protein